MYLAVKRELQAIVSSVGIAGLSALLDVLIAKIGEIDDLHAIQTKDIKAETATRNDALDDMIVVAVAVAGPLAAHAHQQGLHAVEAVADVDARFFQRQRIVERPTFAQKIHDAAVPLVVALTPLGVTEAMLGDLQEKIDAAKALLNEPRTTIIDRVEATKDLAKLFAAIDELLEKQIDRVMAPVELTHPDLYERYVDARKVRRHDSSDTGEPEAPAAAAPGTVTVAAPPPADKAAA
jgi:hypothetical protein